MREMCFKYIKENINDFENTLAMNSMDSGFKANSYEDHIANGLEEVRQWKVFAGSEAIVAFSKLFKVKVWVFTAQGRPQAPTAGFEHDREICVYFLPGASKHASHYESVRGSNQEAADRSKKKHKASEKFANDAAKREFSNKRVMKHRKLKMKQGLHQQENLKFESKTKIVLLIIALLDPNIFLSHESYIFTELD